MNLNTQDNSVNSNSTAIKTIAVHATMRDVYYVLKAIKKEGISPEHEQSYFNFSEHYLHNWMVNGEFEYNTHTDGTWIVRKIKQHKPKPTKTDYPFVVEM